MNFLHFMIFVNIIFNFSSSIVNNKVPPKLSEANERKSKLLGYYSHESEIMKVIPLTLIEDW